MRPISYLRWKLRRLADGMVQEGRRLRRLLVRRIHGQEKSGWQIFLSHSGADGKSALEFSNLLQGNLNFQGFDIEIFNTSDPEYRFKGLSEQSDPQENESLTEYLRRNLDRSVGCIMYASPRSLAANSKWIEYELDRASRQHEELRAAGMFFIPVFIDGATMPRNGVPELVPRFTSLEFRGTEAEMEELVQTIVRRLEDRLQHEKRKARLSRKPSSAA